jgi:hypothetical protein
MADFMTSLWESIFTPGPTPTLIIAANASFGALQVVLLALFLATYSAHFIALSTICAGVWWGINWFAAELRKAKLAEEEADRIRRERRAQHGGDRTADEGGDEDTETEKEVEKEGAKAEGAAQPKLRIRGGPSKIKNVLKSAGYDINELEGKKDETAEASGSQGLEPPIGLQKRRSDQESSTDLSVSGTDSEWEKISETDK